MDPSGEELLFYSGNKNLTHAVRTEFDRLNSDLAALRALVMRVNPE